MQRCLYDDAGLTLRHSC